MLDLKFFKNRKNKTTAEYEKIFSHQARVRLEVALKNLARTAIRGKVTHICVEVSDEELPLMEEVVSSRSIQDLLVIVRTEIPNQFVVGLREVTF